VNIYAIIGAGAIGFIAAWTAQGWRYGEQIEKMNYEQAVAAEKVLKAAQAEHDRQQAKKDEALNEANERAKKNATLARALDGDVDRLRNQLNTARASLPQASCEASRNYAAALSDVFGSCTKELADMAKTLDGTLSDLKTLEQAWPE
jgi:uncharacterized phage infection (PIP) family protein YhgE